MAYCASMHHIIAQYEMLILERSPPVTAERADIFLWFLARSPDKVCRGPSECMRRWRASRMNVS